MAGKNSGEIRCSFCNKTQDQVKKLIAGPAGVYICDECVDICADIIGKLIPIIKTKYPKDDPENLNYKHVTIILEFLVNYMYGG